MRIAIDTHLSEDKMTGIGRYLIGLIEALLDLDTENSYILLLQNGISPNHPLNQIQKPNVRKIPIQLKGPSFKQHWQIPHVLSRFPVDIYHHPHFDLPIGINTPSIITVHDLKYITHPEFFKDKSKIKTCYMKQMLRNSLRRSQKIIAVSESTKADILNLFSIPDKKIRVIHHGLTITQKSIHDNSSPMTHLSQIGISKKYILFVGERRPHKNLVTLIHAFRILLNTVYDIQLVIAGNVYKNYNEPELKVKQLNLKKAVVFIDSPSDGLLKKLYMNAEMLILPSFYEGFGFPLIEGMAYNLPVLGSNRTSIPEILGDAGLLFNPDIPEDIADKISLVLNKFDIRKKLLNKGKERIKTFTWQKCAQQTLELYNQVFMDKKKFEK